jgi:glycerophosphoryl diester phosphodiesterase
MSRDIIKLPRGNKVNLPVLEDGEIAHVVDENELYIGTAIGNVKVTSRSEIGWVDREFNGINFIAHRGLSKYYPENTLKSFLEASRHKMCGWECDPVITSDGQWVIMHDSTIDRTTNGTGDPTVLTLSQIKSYIIDGGNNANIYKGMTVPTLGEVFDLASRMTPKPYIFLNSRTEIFVDGVNTKSMAAIIKKYDYEKRCFLFYSMQYFDGIRKELPNIGVCLDCASSAPDQGVIDSLAKYAPNTMIAILDSILLGSNGQSIVQMCKNKKIPVIGTIVDEYKNVQKMIDMGVTTYITDMVLDI